jgi:DNA-binding NarL/FixJ family response regulator
VSVLIVDDTAACRCVVGELLERRGYRIAGEAESAAVALDLVERVTPDAVLLDVHLPDANGFEVALRLTNSRPTLTVLMTSVHAERSFYARAQASGARGFVPKGQLAQVDLAEFWPAPDRS